MYRLKRDIAEFIAKCPNCRQVKAEQENSSGDQSQKQYDSIWVIVDRMTKSAHFVPVKFTYSSEDYTRIYIDKIVSLHGVFFSILKDRTLNLARGFGYLSKRFGYSI